MTENAGQQPSGPSDRCPSTEPQPSIVHFSGNLPSSSTNFIGSQFHGPVKFEAPTGNQRDYTDPKTECLAAIFKRIGQNPTTVLNSIQSRKGKETPGTCRWILDHERFREWRQHSPSLLCLVRGPGKGKTVLGIYISRILQEIAKDEMTCFFSCEALNKPSTGSTILSCILFQILDQKPNVFKSFEEAFAIQKEQLFEEANFEDLWKAFETIIRNMSLPRINCVLDGVDECTGGTFDLLLQKFKTLFEDCSKFDPGSSTSKSTITPTSVPLGLILIGREDHQICLKRFLSHFENLRIEHDSNQTDGQQNWEEDERLQNVAIGKLVSRSEGTYLWAALVLKELENLEWTEIETAIEDFPKGLAKVYTRLLRNRCSTPSRVETIRLVLMLMCGAWRSLTLLELTSVLLMDPKRAISSTSQARSLLGYCGHLIEVPREDDGLVRLCHASLKEYLLSLHASSVVGLKSVCFSEQDIHWTMSNLCLDAIESTLQNRDSSKKIRDWTDRWIKADEHCIRLRSPESWSPNVWPDLQNKFFPYAALYYPDHARHPSPCEKTKFDLSRVFFREARLRDDWHVIHQNMVNPCWRLYIPSLEHAASNGLRFATHYQFTELANQILSTASVDRNMEPFFRREDSGGEEPPLTRAIILNDSVTAELLVQKGMQVDVPNKHGMTQIHVACCTGNVKVVRLLHACNVSIDLQNEIKPYDQARDAIAGMLPSSLLENQGVTAEEYLGELDLRHLESDVASTVTLLLDRGAEINAKDLWGNSCLHLAARWGCKELVDLLLERAADLKATNNNTEDCLPLASRGRTNLQQRSQIVSKIVKSSGNINKRSENGQTALQVAAHSGNQQIVETLLEEGASFGVADGKGLSALHYAVIGGHRMIVQTLLRPPALSFRSSNSDINTRRPVPGHSTHRRLPCADPDTTDNTGRSPLHLASAFGSLSMVELLVEGGANLNLAIPQSQLTPLHLAIKYGCNLAVTRYLLAKGADTTSVSECGLNALEIAVLCGKGFSASTVIANMSHEALGKTLLHFFHLSPEEPGPLPAAIRRYGNESLGYHLGKAILWCAHERAKSLRKRDRGGIDKTRADVNGHTDIGLAISVVVYGLGILADREPTRDSRLDFLEARQSFQSFNPASRKVWREGTRPSGYIEEQLLQQWRARSKTTARALNHGLGGLWDGPLLHIQSGTSGPFDEDISTEDRTNDTENLSSQGPPDEGSTRFPVPPMPPFLEGVPDVDSTVDIEEESAILEFPVDFRKRLWRGKGMGAARGMEDAGLD